MNLRHKRIMIFGRPGSGKSTCAHTLHISTGIPLYHLDKYFFVENWSERDSKEFMDIQYSLVDQATWIIDGNATRSLNIRWTQADLVLYFNYPRWICYYRVFKRLFKQRLLRFFYRPTFDDRAPGCTEKVSWKLLKYMYSFDDRVRPTIRLMRTELPQTSFYEITCDAELKKFLNSLSEKYPHN